MEQDPSNELKQSTEQKLANFISAIAGTGNILHITLVTRDLYNSDAGPVTYTYSQSANGEFSFNWGSASIDLAVVEPVETVENEREPEDTPLNEVVKEYIESIGTPYDAKWGTMYNGTVVQHTRYDTESHYEISIAESQGGSEGDGEYCHIVFAITKLGVDENETAFVKVTGYYQSYCDTQWDDNYNIVRPTTKVISVYE